NAGYAIVRQREGFVSGNGQRVALAPRGGRQVSLPVLEPGRPLDGASAAPFRKGGNSPELQSRNAPSRRHGLSSDNRVGLVGLSDRAGPCRGKNHVAIWSRRTLGVYSG